MIWATLVSLAIWLVLLFGRGWFWLARERDDQPILSSRAKLRSEAMEERPGTHSDTSADFEVVPASRVLCPSQSSGQSTLGRDDSIFVWPSVVAVVPARNEADGIAAAVGSLLKQDYPGPFRIVVVDDQSTDGTAAIVRALNDPRLTVVDGAPHLPGWTGKLFAVSQGVAAAGNAPAYLWLTDADIAHAPDNLRHLVARAETGKLVLTSLMARLNCESFAERFLIPAFVFFFDMLYPFGWVNDPAKRMAAAAGGCMLVHRKALERAGGIEAIRSEIIDDCALARLMKSQGPIWLAITDRAVSLRPYPRIGDIRGMVARSAYAQLGYSPLILVATVLGMALLYILPVAGVVLGGLSGLLGTLAWAAMTIAFQPMLHFYRRSPFWGLALPVIALFYAGFTIDSAVQHWRGRGGMWKGRAQALA